MLNKIKKDKYLSLFLMLAIFFTYLTDLRYYINDNIYKATNLGNLGAFGAKLQITALVAVLLSVGCVLGWGISVLTRKKVRPRRTTFLYCLSGFAALTLLLFTPYRLQLLMPSQIMQNIAMINCIAVMVFAAVDVALFSAAINTHLLQIGDRKGISGIVPLIASAASALTLALLTAAFRWSFTICIAAYAIVLLAVNILQTLLGKEENIPIAYRFNRRYAIIGCAAVVLVIVLLVAAYFIVEPLIAIVG